MKTTIKMDRAAIDALYGLLGEMLKTGKELDTTNAERKAWGWKLIFEEHKIEVWDWRYGQTAYLYEETHCPQCKGTGKLADKDIKKGAKPIYHDCSLCDGDGKAFVCPCTQCNAILGRKDTYSGYECGVCGFKEEK